MPSLTNYVIAIIIFVTMIIIVIIITIIICRDPPRRPSGPRPAPAVLETGRASTKILHAFKL